MYLEYSNFFDAGVKILTLRPLCENPLSLDVLKRLRIQRILQLVSRLCTDRQIACGVGGAMW